MGVRISALTETTTMADANTLPTDTTSGTRRISWANIKTTIFGAINGLTSKSTPVGADVIVIGDSSASFAGKKVTLTELFTQFPPVTAPASVTPTFTGFGTVSGVNCHTWRVGALLFFEYSFVSGIATATEARMSLRHNPGSGEVDVTTVSNYPTVQPVGGGGADSQVDRYYTALAEASVTYLTIGMFDGSNPAIAKRQGSSLAVSGWRVSLSGSVRINGW